jgi:hypothetical protein
MREVAALGVKDKPKAKARKRLVRKDDQAEEPGASAKAIPKKAAKKTTPKTTPKKAAKKTTLKSAADKSAAAKNAASKNAANESAADKSAEKRDPVKRSRIRDSVEVGKGGAGKTITPELDPFEVAKQTMKGSVPAIVEAMVELAKQGSCSHAKTLLEMTGAKHMFDGEAETRDRGEPWAKLVLERLDESESAAEQESVSLQQESLELAAEHS